MVLWCMWFLDDMIDSLNDNIGFDIYTVFKSSGIGCCRVSFDSSMHK